MAAGPNRNPGNIIEPQDLERSIRNLFHCRDGQSEYAMYFTFELPILYAEFVDRNRNVITDCSHEVLSARVKTIEENELAPTSEIVRLEEAIVDEAISILNNKKELLETLKEELISYKARCGRFRERINNRLGEVNARRAAQAAIARVQETPMDLSRGNRQEVVRERIEQQANLPIVRLRRFDQDQPQIVIPRCDAPVREALPQPPVIPPPENIMADQQQLEIELEQNMEPEVEVVEPEEVVMEIEDYSIDSTESTDTDNDDEIDEVENAIYDQAIHQMENVGNAQPQNVHDWAEEVLANEIAQNMQPPQPQPEPEIIPQQPIVQQVQMDPLPPLFPNNTRFGAEALEVLREYGRDVIIRLRLHEDRPEKAMVHLSTDISENVYGERAIMEWSGVYTHAVGARTHPIPDIRCRLDGAPFVFTGLRRQYALRLFPYIDMEDDAIIATGWLVPPLGHTPDFSLERITLGYGFLSEYLHSINPGLMEVTLRAENGHLVRKRYQLRHRMRN